MLLKYKSNPKGLRQKYHNGPIHLIFEGETKDYPEKEARRLLKEFPHNFEKVVQKKQADLEAEVLESVVEKAPDKMVTESKPKKQIKKKKK